MIGSEYFFQELSMALRAIFNHLFAGAGSCDEPLNEMCGDVESALAEFSLQLIDSEWKYFSRMPGNCAHTDADEAGVFHDIEDVYVNGPVGQRFKRLALRAQRMFLLAGRRPDAFTRVVASKANSSLRAMVTLLTPMVSGRRRRETFESPHRWWCVRRA